jgi:hypothetical protein
MNFDKKYMTLTGVVENDEGDEQEFSFPAKFEVCSGCSGHGQHTHRAIDGNGITSSEWSEWDHDDRESYLNGRYDVGCTSCNGEKVVPVIDEERLSQDQKISYEAYLEHESQTASLDHASDEYSAIERAMGC